MTKCFTTLEVERNKLGTLMKKKVSKSKTQLWVGAIILIIFIQLAKLAHQNEWFSNKNSNLKNKEDFKKFMDSDENKKVKELIEKSINETLNKNKINE